MAAKKERPAPPRKTPSRTAAKAAANLTDTPSVAPDELRKLIAEAAYFRAKKRGFAPGYEVEDWIQAEAEVKQRMGTGR